MKPEKKDWWKVEGRACQKKDGTLVLELKHPKKEYDKKGGLRCS